MKTSNVFFSSDNTSVSFMLHNGTMSSEYKYIDLAIYFLDAYFKEQGTDMDTVSSIFEYLFEEGQLPRINKGYLAPLFILYTLGYHMELDKDHIPYGLVLFPDKNKYHFCGLKNGTEKIPLSPKFYFKHELYTFLDFLHIGGAINDIKLSNFIDHIESIDVRQAEFGGQIFPKEWSIDMFKPYKTFPQGDK